jgi:uncharacterized protein YqeY
MTGPQLSLRERLEADFKTALKAREKDTVSALRMVRSALKLKELEGGRPLDDQTIQASLKSLAKQRLEAAELYDSGGRPELAARERAELELIRSYLPPQVDQATISRVAAEVVDELKPSSPKDMGRVMKESLARLGAGADGKMVSAVVRQLLAKVG